MIIVLIILKFLLHHFFKVPIIFINILFSTYQFFHATIEVYLIRALFGKRAIAG